MAKIREAGSAVQDRDREDRQQGGRAGQHRQEMKLLVIAACQRSGTAWISTVLSAAGHWCGHERWYAMGQDKRPYGNKIDASQAALPLLTGEYETVAWQVRHPLSVAGSMLGKGVFSTPTSSGRWVRQQVPAIVRERTEVEQALRYWLVWNRRIRKLAHTWWKVEDVGVDDIAEALRISGREPSHLLERSLDLVPRINTTGHAMLSWDDVPAGRTKDDALKFAERIGYS